MAKIPNKTSKKGRPPGWKVSPSARNEVMDKVTKKYGTQKKFSSEVSKALALVSKDPKRGNSISIGEVTVKRFLQGESVSEENFRWLSEYLNFVPKEIAYHLRQDWGNAPAPHLFIGRSGYLDDLNNWVIKERCRLVSIFGMGGSGKTWLSAQFAQQSTTKEEFEYIIWRSLIGVPPLEELLADLIKFLSNQTELTLPNDIDTKVSRLIHYLQKHRCLIVLDNVERVLKGGRHVGQYREGYEGYGELFRQIGRSNHESCLLLNSREKPREISFLENQNLPICSIDQLRGLANLDVKELFQGIGSFSPGSLDEEPKRDILDEEWERLNILYAGNPLALRLTAKLILIDNRFRGNVSQFLETGEKVFSTIQGLLDEHFLRLSGKEKEIMYWLAINIEPVFIAELKEDIFLFVEEEIESTLESLDQRGLLDKEDGSRKGLSTAIIDYMIESFVERVSEEIETEEIQLFNSHALLKAKSKPNIKSAQCRLILEPICKRLSQHRVTLITKQEGCVIEREKKIGKEAIKYLLGEMHLKLKSLPLSERGYMAGNILNLLCYSKIDVGSYDFSHLVIRQADLQGIDLQKTNFSYSDFYKSIFTQSFSSISCVTFSPAGTFLAVGDGNGDIRLWRTKSGQQVMIFNGNDNNRIWSISFSPDSKLLASASGDQFIRVWNLETGQCFKSLEGHHIILTVAFSPNGQFLASGSGYGTIQIWDLQTERCISAQQQHTNLVRSLAFSSDSKSLVSSSDDRTVKLWNSDTGEHLKTLESHPDAVWSVAFSPDGKKLVSGCDDSLVRLWDFHTGKCLKIFRGHTSRVRSVAFSSDGKKFASGCDDETVRLWDIDADESFATLQGHNHTVQSVAFSADGKTLASGGYDQVVRLWDIHTGQCFSSWQGYTNWMMSVAYSPDGYKLASASADQLVRLWNAQTGECTKIFQGHTKWLLAVAFSPDGRKLASAGDDKTIRLWDAQTGECIKTFQGHTKWIRSLAFSFDEQILASSSEDQTIKLWSVQTGKCIKTLEGHTKNIWSVAFSPNSNSLASGGEDQTVKLWDIQAGECLRTLEGHAHWIGSVAFSPDGLTVASGCGDQTIRLWDVQTGRCLKILRGDSLVIAIAFSPDGQTIVSGSGDNVVNLWSVDIEQCLKTFQGHTGWIRSVAFSPDGLSIVSGAQDNMVKIWDIQTGECLRTLQARRPYEEMNITGITVDSEPLTDAQKSTLKALGAVEI